MSDYTPILWKDYPGSTDTPITAAQLNRIDNGTANALDGIDQLWSKLSSDVPDSFRTMFPEFGRRSIAPISVATTESLQQSTPYYDININNYNFDSATDGILIYRYTTNAASTRLIGSSGYAFAAPDDNTVRIVFSNTQFTQDDKLGIFIFNKNSSSSSGSGSGGGSVAIDGAYYCNGANDNITLPQFVQQNSSRAVIPVIGTFGVDNSTVQADNNSNYSMVCINSGDRKITIDFTLCSVIQPNNTQFCYFKNCIVTNMNVFCSSIETESAYTVITATDCEFHNCSIYGDITTTLSVRCYKLTRCKLSGCSCDITVDANTVFGIYDDLSKHVSSVSDCSIKITNEKSTGTTYGLHSTTGIKADCSEFIVSGCTAIGAYGMGTYTNCLFVAKGDETGRGASLFSGYFLSATGCTFRGYTKSSSGEGVGIGYSVSGSVGISPKVILTGIRCDLITETGYTQTGSMNLHSSCKGTYSGYFYMTPCVGADMVSFGEFSYSS